MLEQYQKLLTQKVLCEDKAQYTAITALDKLSKQLILISNSTRKESSKNNLAPKKILAKLLSKTETPIHRSLYFYGRVGRGKTMLMDMFYQSIAIKHKKRIHFHRFMESIHQQLNELTLYQPHLADRTKASPLAHIAKEWAADVTLLCFDEFYVSDIGDAMLLSGLFKELFSLGVTLVITSNCQPEQLYLNGLQRERFLPTIDLINQYCQIISVNGEIDHRLPNTPSLGYQNYYFTYMKGEELLSGRLNELKRIEAENTDDFKTKYILINHRKISFLARTTKHIWFDFFSLCSGPRSQLDYIKIADQFETVLLSNVPQFSGKTIPAVFSGVEDNYQRSGILMADLQHLDDEARRFIALVDELYDRKVKLIISSDVDITDLYQGQQLSFEFQRCQSRLFEMQNF